MRMSPALFTAIHTPSWRARSIRVVRRAPWRVATGSVVGSPSAVAFSIARGCMAIAASSMATHRAAAQVTSLRCASCSSRPTSARSTIRGTSAACGARGATTLRWRTSLSRRSGRSCVWVEHSRRYADPDTYLIPPAEWPSRRLEVIRQTGTPGRGSNVWSSGRRNSKPVWPRSRNSWLAKTVMSVLRTTR